MKKHIIKIEIKKDVLNLTFVDIFLDNNTIIHCCFDNVVLPAPFTMMNVVKDLWNTRIIYSSYFDLTKDERNALGMKFMEMSTKVESVEDKQRNLLGDACRSGIYTFDVEFEDVNMISFNKVSN